MCWPGTFPQHRGLANFYIQDERGQSTLLVVYRFLYVAIVDFKLLPKA
jgi:hypothetical protein